MKLKDEFSLNQLKMTAITKQAGKDLTFPTFEDIPVSTKTIIAKTNLALDIEKIYEKLPITDYIVVPKRRGRKKKSDVIDPNKDIETGSIITIEHEDKIRGVDLKKKASAKKKRGKYFRNSVTIIMIVDGKPINFKISRNGKFQLTGCKTDHQAETCLKYFWKYIKDEKDTYTAEKTEDEGVELEILFIPAMRNIDFSLGFLVDREKLSTYINKETRFNSMLEASFGYTGVNIKFPVIDDLIYLDIKQFTAKTDKKGEIVWKEELVPYTKYLESLPLKEQDKKLNKSRYNTFLVFHSGKTILSGLCDTFQKATYYEFLEIIKEAYDEIKEKLED